MEMGNFDTESQKICALDPDALDFWWGDIEALLDETPHLWSHLATKKDIHASLMRGSITAWSTVAKLNALHFLAITLEVEKPNGNYLRVVYMAGEELEQYLPLLVGTLEVVAKRMNCSRLEFMRPGPTEDLLALGYSQTEVIMSRELARVALH